MQKSELIEEYKKVWDGKPWYGENIMSILGGIPLEKILVRLHGSHNMAEIVFHMRAWKLYLIDRSKDLMHRDMPDEENFSIVNSLTAEQWSDLVGDLIKTHHELLARLSDSDVNLSLPVAGSRFTLGQMIAGGLRHDIYHVGQLRFLSKHLLPGDDTNQ